MKNADSVGWWPLGTLPHSRDIINTYGDRKTVQYVSQTLG